MLNLFSNLEKLLPNIKENTDLYRFNTMRVHSKVPFFWEAKSKDDLIKVLTVARRFGIKTFILGGGSNVIITPRIKNLLVIHNKYIEKKNVYEDNQNVDIFVSSGYPVSRLVQYTVDQDLSGLEYYYGLPGTVGGAVYMNSKWMKPPSFFGNNLVSARLLNLSGKVRTVNKEYFQFKYGFSKLQQTREVFLDGIFRFSKFSREVLKNKLKEVLDYRKRTQPFGVATSGCFFKNISDEVKDKLNLPTTSAGYLIDKCGLKGYSIGSFTVSYKHANFIVNNGDGQVDDLLKLVNIIREKVKQKFGVSLEEEVLII